jgi:hypothetical protein
MIAPFVQGVLGTGCVIGAGCVVAENSMVYVAGQVQLISTVVSLRAISGGRQNGTIVGPKLASLPAPSVASPEKANEAAEERASVVTHVCVAPSADVLHVAGNWTVRVGRGGAVARTRAGWDG